MTAYALTDLGSLGHGGTEAADLNDAGQVVGTTLDSTGIHRAFLWENGTMIDLGTLGGGPSFAAGINDLGQVAGTAFNGDGVRVPYLLTPEDTNGDGQADSWFRDLDGDGANDLMTSLGLGGDPTASYAVGADINNTGQVVGTIYYGDSTSQSFLWHNGAFTQLGTLGGAASVANGINDASQVVGFALDALGSRRAFLGDSSHGMVDFGTAAGYDSATAAGINSHGSVVGEEVDSAAGAAHAFFWTPDQPNGTTGTFSDLATGDYSRARDVNDAAQAVGSATYVYVYEEEGNDCPYYPNCGGSYTVTEQRAILWENGVAADLNSLLVESFGVTLYEAAAINGSGQIVAAGSYGAYLLTPSDGPMISISDASVVEGNSDTVSAVFTVSLSATHDQTVTVSFATADGAATARTDYQGASGTLTFAPGETSKIITVFVNGDRLGEPDESFFVNLSGATNATIADGQGVGTIMDDEPRLTIGDASVKEGRRGKTLLTFTVTLSAAYDAPVTVNFATQDGTAKTSNNDYLAKSGSLTFAPGETSKTITIEIVGDRKKEANEYFFVNLFGADGALLNDDQGLGTILNDDK